MLTREQYRALRYQKPYVIQALTTLLASRSVVFIGFGLRDPDFFLVKDFLIETYRGAARDHYAIVADATPPETEYWRRQYGVHLISYATSPTAAGRDHTELLELLHQAVSLPNAVAPPSIDQAVAPLLVQYAARLASLPLAVAEQELPLRVRRRRTDRRVFEPEESLGAFIADADRVALLIGAPGAGKTYSIRRYVASQAVALLSNVDATELDIPIQLDMKLYRGSLWQLAEEQLPDGLRLARLIETRHVKFFIDAVNEMAQEYIEDGRFHADLADFMRRVQGTGIIATSRSEQGLTAFGLVYDLDSLAAEYVQEYLDREAIEVAQQWRKEILDLLRKPLFFRLFAEHTELFRNLTTPNAFYERLFLRVGDRVQQRTGIHIDLARALDRPAFDALDRAQELIPAELILSTVEAAFHPGSPATRREGATRVFDALLSEGILVPHPHGQVSLFHQSATEYLAAPRLARAIAADPAEARRILGRTHWDHSFLLALERVPRQLRREVFTSLLQLDRSFAARAVRYLGSDSSWAVVEFHGALNRDADSGDESEFGWMVRAFPATRTTYDALLSLAARGGILGGAAIEAIASRPLSAALRSRLVQLVIDHVADYNFGSQAAPALAKHLTVPQLEAVLRRFEDLPLDRLDFDAVTATCGALLQHRPLAEALALLEEWNVSQRVRNGVIGDVLFDHIDDETEAVVREALTRAVKGSPDAIFPAYIAIRRLVDGNLLESLVTRDLIEQLIPYLRDGETGRWTAELLSACGAVAAGQRHLARAAENTKGLTRAILLHAQGEPSRAVLWQELDGLSRRGLDADENLKMIGSLSAADWAGHLDILFRFFETKRLAVAQELLDFMRMEKSDRFAPLFEGDKLDWWLSWFESSASDWQSTLVGEVIGNGGPALHQKILDRFNAGRFRQLLLMYVLPRLPERTTDDLNAESISWLMNHAELSRSWLRFNALGAMATEEFVTRELLPALRRARGKRRRAGLLNAIREAGERHRRRYVDEEGLPLPPAR